MYVDAPRLMEMPPVFDRRRLVKRGAVTMTYDPLEFRWNGIRIALFPVETAMLAAVMRRSRLRWDEANAVLAEAGGCADSRDVLIYRTRRKFAGVGAADPIETVRGWGIRFLTESDATGSAAFWIGAIEGAMILDS